MLTALYLIGSTLAFGGDGTTGSSLSVLLGTSTAFDDDPASLRLSIRGEAGPTGGSVAGVSFLMPVTIATRGSSGFGISSEDILLELPPSLRIRFIPESPVSLYLDLGAGLAISNRETSTWFGSTSSSSTVFMTRSGFGIEIGDPNGVAFILEPASLSTYHTSDKIQSQYGLMLGVSVRM